MILTFYFCESKLLPMEWLLLGKIETFSLSACWMTTVYPSCCLQGTLEPVSATWYGTPWTVLKCVICVGHIKWQMNICRVLATNILGFNNHKDIPFILWQVLEYLVIVFVYVCVYVCSYVCTVVCLHECAHVFRGQRSSSVFICFLP